MKPEKIDELYFSDVNEPIQIDRREFLKKLGGGIIVVFCIGKLSLLNGWGQNEKEDPSNFNAYLRVKEDGRIDCYTGKIEMGQGIITSLAQVLADELQVSIHAVDMVMGDTELCPYDAGTWGSLTTRFADPVIRAAAAEAREILLDLAAEKLQVTKAELTIEEGVIIVKNSPSKKITFAEITLGKKIVKSLTKKPEIKKATDFKIIGKPIISTDALSKVTGKAQYSGDIKLPGMVYAKVVRPVVYGSTKIAVDASALAIFEGVTLINEGDLVAVVHNNLEIANKAARKVKVTWNAPEPIADTNTIFQHLEERVTNYKVFKEDGDLAVGKENSTIITKEKYHDGYKAHAPMETHSATCYFKGDKLIIWASTQTPFGLQKQLANALHIELEKYT